MNTTNPSHSYTEGMDVEPITKPRYRILFKINGGAFSLDPYYIIVSVSPVGLLQFWQPCYFCYMNGHFMEKV